ncbi:MAG: signal peptidase I [Candidatus Aenigmarchaeota archaeon]|nr:signal peptidase I [Candidatus Aenigmarchaeota archaeon]
MLNKNNFSILSYFAELIKMVIICLLIVMPIRYFIIQPFYVKGSSMEPNFYDQDYLIIDEISYRLSEPQRDEVVVFKYPLDPRQYFIKRIIGIPGDKIKIQHNQVSVNGKRIDEDNYLLPGITTAGQVDIQLKDNEYFVMGDHRNVSLDSRVFGPVPRDYLIGRVWLRGWPFKEVKVFTYPQQQLGSWDSETIN